jgi:predicted metal-dependent peptidase
MAGVSVDTSVLAGRIGRLGTITEDDRHGFIYRALAEDKPATSCGVAIDTANSVVDGECRQITAELSGLFATTQQSLQSVHDIFANTDSDIAAQVSS